jgi:hypothetical protein
MRMTPPRCAALARRPSCLICSRSETAARWRPASAKSCRRADCGRSMPTSARGRSRVLTPRDRLTISPIPLHIIPSSS